MQTNKVQCLIYDKHEHHLLPTGQNRDPYKHAETSSKKLATGNRSSIWPLNTKPDRALVFIHTL